MSGLLSQMIFAPALGALIVSLLPATATTLMRRVALAGTLTDDRVLVAQTRRMLGDMHKRLRRARLHGRR